MVEVLLANLLKKSQNVPIIPVGAKHGKKYARQHLADLGYLGTSINHVDNFLDIFDPSPQCYKMINLRHQKKGNIKF